MSHHIIMIHSCRAKFWTHTLNLSSLYNPTQLSSFSTWLSRCPPLGAHHAPTPRPLLPPLACLLHPGGVTKSWPQKCSSHLLSPSPPLPRTRWEVWLHFESLLAGLQAVALAVVLKEWNIHGAPSLKKKEKRMNEWMGTPRWRACRFI